MDVLRIAQGPGESNNDTFDVMDNKTGFINRNGFFNFLSNIVAISAAENKNVLVFCVKLVNYKKISELWEESESSNIIDVSSRLIADVVRGRAVCARVKDDTYMIANKIEDDGVTMANSIKDQLSFRFIAHNALAHRF